jgi:hypothetical protein
MILLGQSLWMAKAVIKVTILLKVLMVKNRFF